MNATTNAAFFFLLVSATPALAGNSTHTPPDLDQFIAYIDDVYGYELIGTWYSEDVSPSVTKFWPEGHGCAVVVHETAVRSHRIPMQDSGEVFMSSNVIVGDTRNRGDILIGPIPKTTPAFGCNDYTRTGVSGVDFSGTCWAPITMDDETGIWSKPCSKSAGECNATVNFSAGGSESFSWECTGQGGSRKATGNNNAHTFTAHCAN